ncbi:hypothetical protein CYMTET_40864 [Cymbomonas tetramitiformis]|uniref:U-box domain-containing protein n=2 Tax=Cymbomonas tetramitiformis TaxID=36881 RepID=A0AAE0C996_9CHLO|nr:hypothetical protein CYMTET_40864 [Cymbomonas tetramitiformis]
MHKSRKVGRGELFRQIQKHSVTHARGRCRPTARSTHFAALSAEATTNRRQSAGSRTLRQDFNTGERGAGTAGTAGPPSVDDFVDIVDLTRSDDWNHGTANTCVQVDEPGSVTTYLGTVPNVSTPAVFSSSEAAGFGTVDARPSASGGGAEIVDLTDSEKDSIPTTDGGGLVDWPAFAAERRLFERQTSAAAAGQDLLGLAVGAGGGADAALATASEAGQPAWWQALASHHSVLKHEAQEARGGAFICPITRTLMLYPAFLVETGNTFENSAIRRWVMTEGRRHDPLTNESFSNLQIAPNAQLQREIQQWCEGHAAQRDRQMDLATTAPHTHIFVDSTNILGRGTGKWQQIQQIKNLVGYMEAGRRVQERVVVGSAGAHKTWQTWQAAGYQISVEPNEGKEVFVDDALLAQLSRTASRTFEPRRTLMLLTGDGNANGGRATFPESVEIALRNRWRVEVHAWRNSVNNVYCAFASEYPGHFTLQFLDDAAIH